MTHPIIIIGTGLAGYQLAREFRKINKAHPLVLITEDEGHFYPKPQLSTALTKKKSANTLVTATAEKMRVELSADILTHSKVSALHPDNHQISVNGQWITYSKLVLAIGADVIKPVLAGNAAADILSINHIYHYSAFENLIKNKKTIAILGAGLIGCEFANDLSNENYTVHLIAKAKTPLDLLIPEKMGKLLQSALEKNGVTFHLSCTATRVEKKNSSYEIVLSTGEQLEADFVLSAIGLKPHTQLAVEANITTNRGIIVNRFLETNRQDIYALGDCAEVEGHVLPFIAPILNCAKALAQTLSGTLTAAVYPAMPIVVKTPAHPIAVCPPPKDVVGEWHIETDNHTIRALFYNSKQELVGFVLTNDAVKERMQLAERLPGLF